MIAAPGLRADVISTRRSLVGHDLEPELGLDSWSLRKSDSGGASPYMPLGTAHARRLVREDLEFRDGRLGLLVSAQRSRNS